MKVLLSAVALCALLTNAHAAGFTSQGVWFACGRDDGADCRSFAYPALAAPYGGMSVADRMAGHTADGVLFAKTSPNTTGRDDAMTHEAPLGAHYNGEGPEAYCHTGTTRCGAN